MSRHKPQSPELEHFPGFTELVRLRDGGTSILFRAREMATGRILALKVLDVRRPPTKAYETFEREARPLGQRASHPNIVTVHQTFLTDAGRPVVVTDLCRGSAADEATAGRGRLETKETVGLGVKVAGALESAHQAGVLHRQVKPQNILVTTFGQPALGDFGVARLRASSPPTAGVVGPASRHTAPEVLEGGPIVPATDVYSLASSLYALVAGRPAFLAFEDEPPVAFILRIIRDPVPRLAADDVPVALSDLILAAMEKSPERRPATAREFAAELQRIEVAQGWPETTVPVWEELPTPLAPFTPAGPGSEARPADKPSDEPAPEPLRAAAITFDEPAEPRPPAVVVPVPVKSRSVILSDALAPARDRPPIAQSPPGRPRARPPISAVPRRQGPLDPFPRRDAAAFGLEAPGEDDSPPDGT